MLTTVAAEVAPAVIDRASPPGFQQNSKSGLSLDACRRHVPEFEELLVDIARRCNVDARALAVRTLLHLPRRATYSGHLRRGAVIAELKSNAHRLFGDQRAISPLVPQGKYSLPPGPPSNSIGMRKLSFQRVGKDADRIFSRMHYLRSVRGDSFNFALVDEDNCRPVTLCSVSPLDWTRVGRQIESQFEIPQHAVWDVSRVYSFDVAPANAISYLLGMVRREMRREIPEAQLLTTAVDPNLGFSGSSYRASNWRQWMSIEARPYLYVNGLYTSPRQLRARYGSANLGHLEQENPGTHFARSPSKLLLDPVIFCCRLRGETEAVPTDDQRRLRRRSGRSGASWSPLKSVIAQ